MICKDLAIEPRIQDLEAAALAARAVLPSCADDKIYELHKSVIWLLVQSPDSTSVVCLVEYFTAVDSDAFVLTSDPGLPPYPKLLGDLLPTSFHGESRLDCLWALFDCACFYAEHKSGCIPESHELFPTLLAWRSYFEHAALVYHTCSWRNPEVNDRVGVALLVWAAWYWRYFSMPIPAPQPDQPDIPGPSTESNYEKGDGV